MVTFNRHHKHQVMRGIEEDCSCPFITRIIAMFRSEEILNTYQNIQRADFIHMRLIRTKIYFCNELDHEKLLTGNLQHLTR